MCEVPVRRAGASHHRDPIRQLAHVPTVHGPQPLQRRTSGDERFGVLATRSRDEIERVRRDRDARASRDGGEALPMHVREVVARPRVDRQQDDDEREQHCRGAHPSHLPAKGESRRSRSERRRQGVFLRGDAITSDRAVALGRSKETTHGEDGHPHRSWSRGGDHLRCRSTERGGQRDSSHQPLTNLRAASRAACSATLDYYLCHKHWRVNGARRVDGERLRDSRSSRGGSHA
jgi:hypothetical protein